MEFIFATRGHIDCTEKFIRNLRSVWMKFQFTDPVTKQKAEAMEMNVKPLLLWDIAFPKEHLDTVLNTLVKDRKQHKKDMKKRYWFLSTAFNQLRKLLKLKPIPMKKEGNSAFPVYTENVEILPIGIKEDGTFLDGEGKEVEGV